MQQPSLGKKIAKLRKAKGLTQEELVEKCNLSVRTLQRIESGEVIPRSYTVKLIFSALGHDVYESAPGLSGRLNKAGEVAFNSIRKFCSYTIDLFNLKTNAMKKLTILSIFFLTLCTVIFSACLSTKKAMNNQAGLIGTWQILKNGQPDTTYGNQTQQIRYKIITPGRFMVTDIKYKEKLMYAAFSGSFTIMDGNTYSEFIETAGNGYSQYLGMRNSFKYTIADSLLTVQGTNNNYNEVWKKVK